MSKTTVPQAQLIILKNAARHPDGVVIMPERFKGAVARKMRTRFVELGLITVEDGEEGAAHHLTPAGYRAVGMRPPRKGARVKEHGSAVAADEALIPTRPATKQAMVLDLLGRAEGASIAELMAATGWLAHTTRAALTGFRKKGVTIARSAEERGTVYRIAASGAPTVIVSAPTPAPKRSLTKKRPRSRPTAAAQPAAC